MDIFLIFLISLTEIKTHTALTILKYLFWVSYSLYTKNIHTFIIAILFKIYYNFNNCSKNRIKIQNTVSRDS